MILNSSPIECICKCTLCDWLVSSRKLWSFTSRSERNRCRCLSILQVQVPANLRLEPVLRCPILRAASVEAGSMNVFRGLHPTRCHVPKRRTWNLTDILVKTDMYPAAYGGFSDVWSCHLQYSMKLPSLRVAVKAIRPMISSEEEFHVKKKAIIQELMIWIELNHENILPLYGITYGFGHFPAFVCPWANNGTLSEYLEKHETQLGMKKRLSLLIDVAAGLQYLHSCYLAHGDLSGMNVLITGKGQACLSDFGLSTLVEQASDTTVSEFGFPGNIRWAAPELFGERREGDESASHQQADIYSFGSVMLQTLTGKLPFHWVERVAQIVIMISRGDQPRREPRWDGGAIPDELWKFMEACWDIPSERPSSKEIVRFIKERQVP